MKDMRNLHYFLNDITIADLPQRLPTEIRSFARNSFDETRFEQIAGSLIYLTITQPKPSHPIGLIISSAHISSAHIRY